MNDAHARSPRTTLTQRTLEHVLTRMPVGTLTLERTDGTTAVFRGAEPGPSATVTVRDSRAAARIARGGGIGFAEGYMDGLWDTPDLTAVLDLGLANLERVNLGRVPTPLKPIQRGWHRLRANTKRGARRNIAYHYDLGNDFYELWLDDAMTYSSALFCNPEDQVCSDLTAAQRAKWDALLDLLQPSHRDHLLEIGCGWGGFAVHAAKTAECKVTGITLSEEQHDWAIRRVTEEGLEGRVDIRLQDYRDVNDTYSGIASIEMFEAVGERYWPVFFDKVYGLLDKGGRAAIQTITIRDESFENYRDNPDFIQRYIFPGGMLPSPERFRKEAEGAGLSMGEPHSFGESYAHTLEHWLERFDAAQERVRSMGFDERFVRMWRYYLAYCRTGFLSGNIDVMQVQLER